MKIKMNIPNILTMIRIFCTPIMILLYLLPIPLGIGKFTALFVYIFGCLTDLFDGYIARKYNMITDFGKFMDQIADKFITTTAMILVLFSNVIYTWLAVLLLLVVVLRDILISGIRMVAANKNFVIPADIYGKIKSFFLDIANMIVMLAVGLGEVCSGNFVDYIRYFGISVMIVGVILSVVSCINYSVNAVKTLSAMQAEGETDDEMEETQEVEVVVSEAETDTKSKKTRAKRQNAKKAK